MPNIFSPGEVTTIFGLLAVVATLIGFLGYTGKIHPVVTVIMLVLIIAASFFAKEMEKPPVPEPEPVPIPEPVPVPEEECHDITKRTFTAKRLYEAGSTTPIKTDLSGTTKGNAEFQRSCSIQICVTGNDRPDYDGSPNVNLYIRPGLNQDWKFHSEVHFGINNCKTLFAYGALMVTFTLPENHERATGYWTSP